MSSWWDLTKPEWNGKFFLQDPLTDVNYFITFTGFLQYADEFAADYEKVFGEKLKLSSDSPRAVHKLFKRLLANNPVFSSGSDETCESVGNPNAAVSLVGYGTSSKLRKNDTDGWTPAPIYNLTPATSLTNVNNLIFDMGGTLENVYHKAEFNESCGKKLLAYLARHGIRLDFGPVELVNHIEAQNKLCHGESGIKELYPHERWADKYLHGMDIGRDMLCIIADNLANIWKRNYYYRALRPGAIEMLEQVKKMGIFLGIISNTGCLIQVVEILHEYNIHRFFDCVYLSSVS